MPQAELMPYGGTLGSLDRLDLRVQDDGRSGGDTRSYHETWGKHRVLWKEGR